MYIKFKDAYDTCVGIAEITDFNFWSEDNTIYFRTKSDECYIFESRIPENANLYKPGVYENLVDTMFATGKLDLSNYFVTSYDEDEDDE